MKSLKEIINKKPKKECKFQIINTFSNKINKFLIIKNTIYIFLNDNTFKIYNCISFKELGSFKLPFNTINYEVIDKNLIILFDNNILYQYKINIKENKLEFVFYILNVYMYKFLMNKKEILLIMNSSKSLAKVNLLGQIIFYIKEKPKILFNIDGILKNKIYVNTNNKFKDSSNYIFISGFNKDKYIMHIFGYTVDNYDYSENNYTICIYNSDKLNILLKNSYLFFLMSKKISDKFFIIEYFIKLFYYNEKNNEIIFIDNIDIENISEFYYLSDDICCAVYNSDSLYIFDFSKNIISKKIIFQEDMHLEYSKNFYFLEYNGITHYYYLRNYKGNKIIHGIAA